jgi:hypothetical protein
MEELASHGYIIFSIAHHYECKFSFFPDGRTIRIDANNRENEIFKGKLNLEKIGIFGMSMGGIASSEICTTDRRVKAGISIDGGLYGSVLNKNIQMPFMFLNSKRFHYNLTDYSIYPTTFAMPLMGTIDGNKMMEIMNLVVLTFFDKYLGEKDDMDLVQKAKEYSEIEIVTNIEGFKSSSRKFNSSQNN